MKKIILLLILLLLTGCASSKTSYFTIGIDNLVENLPEVKNITNLNVSKYYSYSLPSDVCEMDGNQNAAVIAYNNSMFIMNLNIASVINNKYYEEAALTDDGFLNKEKLIYSKTKQIVLTNGNESTLTLSIYKDKYYYIHLYTNEINMYGKTNEYEIVDLAKKMLQVAQTIDVDSKEVIANYSLKEVIDYKKKQIDLFDFEISTEGFLSDMVKSVDGQVIEPGEDQESQDNNDEIAPIESDNVE